MHAMKHLKPNQRNDKDSTQTKTRTVTPSLGRGSSSSLSEGKSVGEWLCADGPYRRYIEALSETNPGLKTADPNNKEHPLTMGNATVVLLESSSDGQPEFKSVHFDSCAALQTHFEDPCHDHSFRRIYIMEGLAPDYVATIGGRFFMEPTFWLRQERTCIWSNDFTPVSDALPQPSLLKPDEAFHVQYCELREFDRALENKPSYCNRTGRHVGMTAARMRDRTTTAIMRRKVSWWCEKTKAGGWDVVILCDPSLGELHPPPKEVVERHGIRRLLDLDPRDLKNTPFQGGYVDFIPPPRPERRQIPAQIPDKSLHPHESMLRDLEYYFLHKTHHIKETDWKEPSTSAIFLKKIVAAHYLQLADYIKAMLPSLELKLVTAWVEEHEQWKQLGTISRRCGNYRDDIEDTMLSLGFSLDIPKDKRASRDWADCELDYQYVYHRLKVLKERADNLMSSMTGLASIAGNRQNLEEAKRVKRLNLLALLFIPLAYTSSLFSMQDNYAPNKPQFWVYWVCAIGVVIFTSIVTWLLDRALNEEAQWTLESFKILQLWGDKGAPQAIKRAKGTNIWGANR